MKPKLTPWFPGEMKPARPGVYQTQEPGTPSPWFNYFDGHGWHFGVAHLAAYDLAPLFMWDQPMGAKQQALFVKSWRGLASKP